MTTFDSWRPSKPRKPSGYPWKCTQCHKPIDVEMLVTKIKAGKRYTHPCGRVLAKGDAVLRMASSTGSLVLPATDATSP
jgi:hypothetical protein